LSNISARIGGEEFLQVLTYADERAVRVAVDRVRKEVEAEKFTLGGESVGITASFGVAGFCGNVAPAFSQLLSQADAALYRAKQLGRNRIEIDPMKIT
jgi:diguanylate cyclase (GGDEF)-like protein